jgi:hypothetical protein
MRRLLRAFDVARAMMSGQPDALQLAIQQQAETQELLHGLAASADEVAAVLRYWQEVCDIASGAESLAIQRHSSALLDRFLVISVMNRSPRALHVLRKVGAAHCIGRGLGWTDSDLRYVRSYIMFQALPEEERAVIALPPFPPSRREQLDAVMATAALVAEKIEQSREALLSSLRSAGTVASPAMRTVFNSAIALASMQDMRRLVDFHVNEFTKCSPLLPASAH